MAIALSDMRAQVRSELGISETDLPDALALDYINMVQIEVAQMLGPVSAPSLRKRSSALLGGYSGLKQSVDGNGTYTDATKVLNNFSGLTVNYYAGSSIAFVGTFSVAEVAFKDIVVSNTATTVTIAGNCQAGVDGTSVLAVILHDTKAVDVCTLGVNFPSDCMYPIYLSTSTTPSSESRIDIIQIDDTEQYFQNEYWDSESVAAIQVGSVAHIIKGSSASFASTVVSTYVRRPDNFSADTDQLKISEGRLPEEFWGIIRAGVLKMAAMHLRRRTDMIMQGDDMDNRVSAIQRSYSMSDAVTQREKVTT